MRGQRRRKAPTNVATTKTPAKKKSIKKKRLPLGVGDLVSFNSMINHMTGSFGEVIAVLDQDHVVIKGMGATYEDYDNRLWVALTYKPKGTTSDGENLRDISIWVRKLLYSRSEVPPKVKKPKTPAPVALIEGTDALLQVLASDEATKHAKVHFVPDTP